MTAQATGSVRVDLLGGTLDIPPLNHVLRNVITLNLATSLKAVVKIESCEKSGVSIHSKDYNTDTFFDESEFTEENLRGMHFGPLNFLAQILDHLDLKSQVKITLESGSPAGAGLGGSSAMGVTFFQAICQYKGIPFDRLQAIREVNTIEARILNSGPAGYQDYYPAVFGGVLALKAVVGGVDVEQLYSEELKTALEDNLTLVYSGQTRLSGINNWEVFKQFFDKDEKTIEGLTEISHLSFEAYEEIKKKNFSRLIELIGREGEVRKSLFPNIQTEEMNNLHKDLLNINPKIKLKVCGAGGGGCFLICHEKADKMAIQKAILDQGMTELQFSVEEPL